MASVKNLVIVESPAKAKTIEKFLGKDFVVKSSLGHIRDLPPKGMSIDISNNFEPTYEIADSKKKTVRELKAAAKGAEVWLASDEDREGEAIAWHLTHALGLDPSKTKRIVFHEITKSAIENAVKNPRTIDQDLVDAQQARRIIDRLVGYGLSPVLWKKVRPKLSAGRVQSVAVRLIVEREREISNHKAESKYRVTSTFKAQTNELPAELNTRFTDADQVKEFLGDNINAEHKIAAVSTTPGTRNPSAPFTTSTLQQEASRRLSFSVKQTMSLAQRLYESGLITYMRTDSTVLSSLAIKSAEDYIKSAYGPEYHKFRQYKTKNQSAQEAHEAIRPTDFSKTSAGSDELQKKLYQLIWKRSIASQMSPASIDKTEVSISISTRPEKFIAKGEILKFDGFLKVYGGGKDDVILPKVNEGDAVERQEITATQVYSRAPARYSEASLVKALEENGIGRPSTYAPTINTIQVREYINKADVEGYDRQVHSISLAGTQISEKTTQETTSTDRNKLVPTHLADVTTDFLVKYFPSIIDYDFTAKAESEFDNIAEGKIQWKNVVKEFHDSFQPLIDKSDGITRQESTQSRQLGLDPKSGKPIMARYGRYGPMLQRGETESEEKPDFAPMPEDKTIETITLEQALEMFKLPRLVGTTDDGKEIKANIGRFGPYIQVDKLFVSIKPHDPMKITEEEARQLYADKLEKEKNKYIQTFDSGIQVINGPYGPYITDGKKNARIPKASDPTKITEADAKQLLEKAPAKKKRIARRKKS